MIESAVHNGIPKKGSTGSNRAPRWSPWDDSGGLVKEYATRSVTLRLAGALWWYWRQRGHVQEGIEWLQPALANPAASGRTAVRTKTLTVTSNLINRLGDFASATSLSEEGVGIWREVGDDSGLAMALLNYGNNLWRLGDSVAGDALMRESVERARKVGDVRNLPQILGNLAGTLIERGEREQTRPL